MPRLPVVVQLVPIVGEKIAAQYPRDAQQRLGVDAAAPEYVVRIGAVAVEFPCEPCDGALLTAQLLPDKFSDVYHVGLG